MQTNRLLWRCGCLIWLLAGLPQAVLRAGEADPAAASRTIHLSPEATPAIRTAAEDLARWFKKISNQELTISTNRFAGQGIYLTVRTQDQHQQTPPKLATLGPEGIFIRSTTNSLYVVANSDMAVGEGVSLYLDKLGCRWYLVPPEWQVVPRLENPLVAWETLTQPAFEFRSIWYTHGAKSPAGEMGKEWARFNRLGGAFRASAGHAYPGIIKRNQADFDQHPEYFAILANGERDTQRGSAARKFCVTNEGLIQLCVADALRQFAESPETQMVSLDPSDGPGSCECEKCRKIGTVSDRVFYLANRVALAVGEKCPGKWVGLYAYSDHQMPTSLKLAPNLYVMLATCFNYTPLTIDELIAQWGKRVTRLGIREYYGVWSWDHDMPGRPRLANVDYLRKSIPHFHRCGANAISAESLLGSLSRGPGGFVAARLMWDPQADVDALLNEFYDRCFGKARGPIEEMFDDWRQSSGKVPTGHELAKWMRLVAAADQLAENEAVRARLDQLKSYLHVAALFHDHSVSDEEQERRAYENLLRYGWRIRDEGLFASYAMVRVMANNRAPTPAHKFNNPKAVWKEETPVSREEIHRLFQADRARFKEVQGLRNVSMPERFAPLADGEGPVFENTYRGPHELVVRIPREGGKMAFAFGFVYDKKFTLEVKFFPLEQDLDEEATPLHAVKMGSDCQFHEVDLKPLPPGDYRLMVDDRRCGFRFQTSGGVRWMIRADALARVWTARGRSNFYFQVPAGTEKFMLIGGSLTLKKPNGEKLEFQTRRSDREIEIPVGKGEEGVWQILQAAGIFHLVGVPPMVGGAPQLMLTGKPGS